MPTTIVFDHEASLRRMGDDAELFREMVELLRDDGPRRLRDVAGGLNARDAGRIRHAAHTLKGLAANFSAARAVAAAARVEHLAREENWIEIHEAVAELQQALAELLSALQVYAFSADQPASLAPLQLP